jgi:hypothetical protein
MVEASETADSRAISAWSRSARALSKLSSAIFFSFLDVLGIPFILGSFDFELHPRFPGLTREAIAGKT